MRLKVLLILVLALIWTLISWRWYTCGIKGFCGAKPAEVVAAVTPVVAIPSDLDGDGLKDVLERTLGTDPKLIDTDADGVSDAYEVGDNTSQPLDTDNDGIINALDTDDDNDGLLSNTENNDPNGDGNPMDAFDIDGDKMPDFLDADHNDGPYGDLDNDGLINSVEARIGTDPRNKDTDGDGISDGDETDDIKNPRDTDGDGLINALDANKNDGPLADPDGDSLSNADEARIGTDPNNPDTDGDGINDGVEVALDRMHPLDADNNGIIDALEVYAPPVVAEPEPIAAPVSDKLEVVVAPESYNARIYFPYDNAENPDLSRATEDYFKKIVTETQAGRQISLVGHTDDRGTDAYNLSLGLQRAKTTRQLLIDHGASVGAIRVSSHGESEPIQPNDTDAGRQANRRVELTID